MYKLKYEEAPYSGLRQEIEHALTLALNRVGVPSLLNDANHYAVFPAGKRIRPLLSLSLCADLNGPVSDLVSAASALELLHCASLIHDDLPALDNDDERRGRPSCHKAFPESTAILSGDFLVPLAFKQVSTSPLNASLKIDLSEVLAQAYMDLCAGQQFDLLGVQTEAPLEHIHRLKTGALFRASALFCAISLDIKPPYREVFAQFGESIGIAFQVLDDFYDRFGTARSRGRLASSDEKNNRKTYGEEEAKEVSREELIRLIEEKKRICAYLLDRIEKTCLAQPEKQCALTRALLESVFAPRE